jgi:hypothetical protein
MNYGIVLGTYTSISLPKTERPVEQMGKPLTSSENSMPMGV